MRGYNATVAIPYTLVFVFLSFFGVNAARVVLTLYALKLGASPATVGLLGGVFYVFPLLLSLPVGAFADRHGARPLLIAGGVCATTALLLPFMLRELPVFFVAAALSGMSLAFYHVTLQNQIGVLSAPQDRTRNFANFSMGGAVANFAGPIVAGFSIDHVGHAWACMVIAAFSLLALVLMLLWNRVVPPHRPVVAETPAPASSARTDVSGSPGVRGMLVMSGFVQLGTDIFQFYIPVYGYSIGLSATAIGMALSAFAASSFLVRIFLARMVRRWRPEVLLAGSFYIGTAGFLMVPLFASAPMMALSAFIFGMGMGIGTPLTVMMMFSRSSQGRSGRALGLRLTWNNLVRVTGPMVFGSVAVALGLLSVFWINALLMGASGAWAQWRMHRDESQTSG